MRVFYIYATSSGSPPTTGIATICSDDDALQIPENSGKSTIDIFSPTRAESVEVFDRKLFRTDLTLIVTRSHPSIAAARWFSFEHPTSFPSVGVLRVQNGPGASTALQWTWIKGGISGVRTVNKGIATITTYTFVGGRPSSTALTPNPISPS